MSYTWFLLISLLLGLMVYRLLPAIICRLDGRLAQAQLGSGLTDGPGISGRLRQQHILPDKWILILRQRMVKAGYFKPSAPEIYLVLLLLPLPVLIWLGHLAGIESSEPALIAVMIICLVNSRISLRIKARQKSFSKALYKIYRFLDLQLTAGIKITDSLRGLPEAILDPVIKPVFVRFAAHFTLTMDLDQAFTEIRRAFPGSDCELLATHLRQCLQTGQAGRSLLRMEELLFTRYFGLMQAETQQIRTHLLLTALLGIFPGIILFLYPLLYEALTAIQSVFG